MGTLPDLLALLSRDPHVRGRQFEILSRWFFENDPLYQAELQKVWLWRDWPGRWGADAGIDLVAETRDGRLWAVQAKAYDSRYPIKKAPLPKKSSSAMSEAFTSAACVQPAALRMKRYALP